MAAEGGLRDSMAFLRAERERHPDGLLLVTPGPSTTASALRLLARRDPSVEVRYVDPETVDGPRALGTGGAGRAVFVIVSVIEGVRLPPDWARDVAPAFASFKADGAAADQVYRACPTPACR